MTFCKPTCPECGHPATHILEMVYLHTPIEFVTDVTAEWREDESPEVIGDTSDIVRDGPESLVTLHCRACAKSWPTTMGDAL